LSYRKECDLIPTPSVLLHSNLGRDKVGRLFFVSETIACNGSGGGKGQQMFPEAASQMRQFRRRESIKNGQKDQKSREFCTNPVTLFCSLFSFV